MEEAERVVAAMLEWLPPCVAANMLEWLPPRGVMALQGCNLKNIQLRSDTMCKLSRDKKQRVQAKP
eukprot:9652220-Heterocapsa_arctica.AAC.1